MLSDEAPVPAPIRPSSSITRRGETAERRRMEQDLRQAVATDAFCVHYQPRQHLAGGTICAAEALLRLPSRRRGLMAPAALIPAVENGPLVDIVAAWLLRTSCMEAAAWRGEHPPVLSVNLPSAQLRDGSILQHLALALEASRLAPERLELELTESVLLAPEPDMLLTLAAIRDLGVGLLADEFGLALASLCSLRHLPLTALKLDRSLVRDLARDPEDRSVIRAITLVAHVLDVRVVAEGVEAQAQRDILRECGCDEVQGSLVSHPLSGGLFLAFLDETAESRTPETVDA